MLVVLTYKPPPEITKHMPKVIGKLNFDLDISPVLVLQQVHRFILRKSVAAIKLVISTSKLTPENTMQCH